MRLHPVFPENADKIAVDGFVGVHARFFLPLLRLFKAQLLALRVLMLRRAALLNGLIAFQAQGMQRVCRLFQGGFNRFKRGGILLQAANIFVKPRRLLDVRPVFGLPFLERLPQSGQPGVRLIQFRFPRGRIRQAFRVAPDG